MNHDHNRITVLGWIYRRGIDQKHQFKIRNYYLQRDFQTFLPIGSHIPFVPDDGVVAFDRVFFGGGLQYTYTGELFGKANLFTAGLDIDIQRDDRRRHINVAGERGELSFDQLERAAAKGIYFQNSLNLTHRLVLSAGGRMDDIELSVTDHFQSNGDQSSDLNFREFSPTLGMSWRVADGISVYAQYGTAFETPTFTELANPARNLNVNLGGFSDVAAQTADSFEIGVRGTTPGEGTYLEIAAFTMKVSDEVTGVSNLDSRSFFENADTNRDGFEAAVIADLSPELTLTATYTFTDFAFTRFPSNPSARRNAIPGIPQHQLFLELAYRRESGLFVVVDALSVDEFFIDNDNSEVNPAYQLVNLRAGHHFSIGNMEVSPHIGVNNLFDEEYNANARLNAFGGRSYEPAPAANFYAGISLRFSY